MRDPARDVDERSDVAVDGKPVSGAEPHEIWALHKPAGVVSTAKDTHGRRTVLDLVSRRRGGCTRSGASTPTRPASS